MVYLETMLKFGLFLMSSLKEIIEIAIIIVELI